MDFADSLEHAAFRPEFRHWLATNLPEEIKVDDAADQRVAPDRETLEKRIARQKRMHAACLGRHLLGQPAHPRRRP
jgi:hypothetical protein